MIQAIKPTEKEDLMLSARYIKRCVFLGVVFFYSSVIYCQVALQGIGKSFNPDYLSTGGTAIVITGAAARIPQEAALLEQLEISGWLKDPVFISGASSGALNTVVLNAILSGKFTWNQYRKILFSVSNNKVFNRNGYKLPLDTEPLRQLLASIVTDSLGYRTMADLPIPSSISATNLRIVPAEKKTLRFSNVLLNAESNPALSIIDILMASTAIPVVFPPQKIHTGESRESSLFIDGGIADDHIPYESVIQYENLVGKRLGKMIIVSRKSDAENDIRSELDALGLKDSHLLEKIGVTLEKYSSESFMKKLLQLKTEDPDPASRTYIYIPDFEMNFPLLNFNTFPQQYEVTGRWAKTHLPVALDEYITANAALFQK